MATVMTEKFEIKGSKGRQIMERTIRNYTELVNDDNATDHREDRAMRKAKNFVKIGLEVLKEVRHNWEEAEKRY
jgi:hypothetical protein